MAYCVEVPRSRLGLRVSILTLIAVGIAGCSSDVTRFDSSPFSRSSASNNAQGSGEVTGSIRRAPDGKVIAQPLPQTQGSLPPPPPRHASGTGVAAGAPGMGSYRPQGSADVTGSIGPAHTAARPQPPAPARTAMAAPQPQSGQATVVTVGPGDTLASYSRRYGVSMAVLIKANNLTNPNSLTIGQRIVIPGHHGAATAHATAPASVPAAPSYGGFHVAGPGDTLSKIARRYRVSVADLARANRLSPQAQIKLGDRLNIPAKVAPPAAHAQAAPPQVAAAAPAPAPAPQQVASGTQRQSANLATPTHTPEETTGNTGSAGFRWPVRGRIVTAFGAKPNGQQNDGINIAVPEGTPVKAAEEGEVAYAGNELKGYGNLILVRHPNGFVTAYAHASELLVKRGDKVKRGQVIAKSGRTGNISAPQLHFEIRKGSTPVDPMSHLGA